MAVLGSLLFSLQDGGFVQAFDFGRLRGGAAGGRGLAAPRPLQPPTPRWDSHPLRGLCPFRRPLPLFAAARHLASPFRCPGFAGTSVRAASELPPLRAAISSAPCRADMIRQDDGVRAWPGRHVS